MHKFVVGGLSLLLFAALTFPTPAGEPAQDPEEPKTYTVAVKLIRKALVTGADGKAVLDPTEARLPALTTLEGTRAEYHTGGKLNATPYGFRLQVEVKPAGGDKVRLEVLAEDSSVEGGFNQVVRTNSQRVVRRLATGRVLKLELYRNDRGEAAWVELTVHESKDE